MRWFPGDVTTLIKAKSFSLGIFSFFRLVLDPGVLHVLREYDWEAGLF